MAGRTAGSEHVPNGWFETEDENNRVTDDEFSTYAQLPSPGVAITSICNEAETANHTKAAPDFLNHICPENGNYAGHATENIIGWYPKVLAPAHNFWRSVFSHLGFAIQTAWIRPSLTA